MKENQSKKINYIRRHNKYQVNRGMILSEAPNETA